MSELLNAPLQEVSAQLKWHLQTDEFKEYSFFAGDYYFFIKNRFERREEVAPQGIPLQWLLNNPTHKFLKNEFDFPFIILGPGLVALNVNDENYFWDDYRQQIKYTFKPIFEIIPKISAFDHIHLSLEYINFFEFDFNNDDIFKYLKQYLNTEISQLFMSEELNGLDINLSYKYTDLGSIKLNYNRGKIKGKGEGLIVRTSIDSGIYPSDLDQTLSWFESAHEKCSQLFKDMTKGILYETFK